MALGNLRKRKSVVSASNIGKPTASASKRSKSTALGAKNGKSLCSDSKKRQKKTNLTSPSPRRSGSSYVKGKICGLFNRIIESGTVKDREPVSYIRKKDQTVMKEGKITRYGVLCSCCKNLFCLSDFEAHAGSALHRPSASMFLRDGRSLMECFHPSEFSGGIRKENSIRRRSTSKGKSKSPKDKSKSDDGNDNICQICGDGGQLMLCDSCPSAFHCKCLHLDEVPEGDWHCSRCRCGSCGLGKSLNTREPSSTMVSCMQCRIPYHRSCVSRPMDGNDSSWFCTKICQTIFGKLRKIVGQVFALDKGLSWTLVRFPEGSSDAPECENFKDKFSEALKLMQQSFDPVIDQETGMDVLSQLVYNRGSHVKRLDCSGFYTLMLMKEEQLVAVASIRPHGKILAEMPFIATSYEFRQQGMCKALMQALEFMLCGVGIYKLVIPSINEVVDIWTGSFGFRIMSNEDCKKFSGMNFLLFPGTTLLSKSLLGIGPRTRSETCSESKAQGRSVIQVKEQMVTSSKASLSRSRPIACH